MSMHTFVQEQLTLLVVAPNEDLLNLCNAMLALNDSRILLTDRPETAFDMAMKEQPDVILATSGLHEIGALLCQRVRQEPLIAQTPFVILTTSSNHKTYATYFEYGCDQILPIPFKCAEIFTAIEYARKRNLQRDHSKIHVLFKSGLSDFIDSDRLNQFLATNEVLCFHRKSGLAIVGRDPIRRGSRAGYAESERRQRMM